MYLKPLYVAVATLTTWRQRIMSVHISAPAVRAKTPIKPQTL